MPDVMAYTMPLSGAAHNNRAFQWSPLLDKCFESIKALATKAPILKPVDFNRNEPVWVITVSSKTCMVKAKAGNDVINGVKLRYLCHNKLPRIILVFMHGDDYVINVSSISPGVRR